MSTSKNSVVLTPLEEEFKKNTMQEVDIKELEQDVEDKDYMLVNSRSNEDKEGEE